ncbi:MAG: radical SAM protein [Harvfovirus sp.]|uniref:Radical SAM protein n=1 Tax=Harvfovirus sp. TaxID=2487768 RepID=A0A3G5A2W3_9VIRU|nr:MAG: radical SAM protein [Harvfovirus sp.]
MKYFITFSSAGLGNILLPFLSGKIISNKTGRKLILLYSKGPDGNIDFHKLFNLGEIKNFQLCHTDISLKVSSLNHYFSLYSHSNTDKAIYDFAIGLNEKLKPDVVSYTRDYNYIYSDVADAVCAYSLGWWIANYKEEVLKYDTAEIINKRSVKAEFKQLNINPVVQLMRDNYVRDNGIDHNTFGIHLRLTDFKNNHVKEIEKIKYLVENIICLNPGVKFFVCSDEKNVEMEFIELFGRDKIKNFEKGHYPEFNALGIFRDEQVILESFVDMLIFASCTVITDLSNRNGYNGYGTFNNFARILSNETRYLTGYMRFIPNLCVGDISLEGGSCYVVTISEYKSVSDIAGENRSELILFEDEVKLDWQHSAHEDIRNLGGGRYSHWDKYLYFSTRDNSDPRENGRVYKFVIYN